MVEVLFLIELLNVNIFVAAALGAFAGEALKEWSDDIEIEVSAFIKEFVFSFVMAFLLGTITFEVTEKILLSLCAAALSGLKGHKHTVKLMNEILEKICLKD